MVFWSLHVDGVAEGTKNILFLFWLSLIVEALVVLGSIIELNQLVQIVIVFDFLVNELCNLIFSFDFLYNCLFGSIWMPGMEFSKFLLVLESS